MLTIKEATEIDEIIGVLRAYDAAQILYAVASLNEQGVKQLSFDLFSKMNPEIRSQNSFQGLRYLKKMGLIEIKKLTSRHVAIKFTPRGRKYAAFVRVAHGTELLRYLLLMKLGISEEPVSIKYATRVLFSVLIFLKRDEFSFKSAGDIISYLKKPMGSVYRGINLLAREEFLRLVKPSFGPRSGYKKNIELAPNGHKLLSELERAYRAYQKA